MTQMPAGAQVSDDGQWWWDGTQWQAMAGAGGSAPVATEPGAATSGEAPASADPATPTGASQSGGAAAPEGAQRSDDGQWWWDGSQWQPTAAGGSAAGPQAGSSDGGATTAAAPGQPEPGTDPGSAAGTGATADGGPNATSGGGPAPASAAGAGAPFQLSVAAPTADPGTFHDGTPGINARFDVTNAAGDAIPAGAVTFLLLATSTGTAEHSASAQFLNSAPLDPGSSPHHGPLQVDPGSWTLTVIILDATATTELARSPETAFEVAGAHAADRAFDASHKFDLAVAIHSVEHLSGPGYRVHYRLTNHSTEALPPGLTVVGAIGENVSSGSAQTYQLTTGVAAGHSAEHYLTLELPTHEGTVTAEVTADLGGPSEASSSVTLSIDEHGVPTITG